MKTNNLRKLILLIPTLLLMTIPSCEFEAADDKPGYTFNLRIEMVNSSSDGVNFIVVQKKETVAAGNYVHPGDTRTTLHQINVLKQYEVTINAHQDGKIITKSVLLNADDWQWKYPNDLLGKQGAETDLKIKAIFNGSAVSIQVTQL